MGPEDLILVSIDDHVIEPPDLFERHVPEKWKSEAPRCIEGENVRKDPIVFYQLI